MSSNAYSFTFISIYIYLNLNITIRAAIVFQLYASSLHLSILALVLIFFSSLLLPSIPSPLLSCLFSCIFSLFFSFCLPSSLSTGKGDQCAVGNVASLDIASGLLGVTSTTLGKLLTSRTMVTRQVFFESFTFALA